MRAAAVQMTSTADKGANLATAARLVADAAAAGAELVVLPEMFNCLGTGAELRAGAEPLEGETSAWAGAIARDHGIVLVAGSFVEAGGDDAPVGHNFNTSCVYSAWGERVAVYRKVHLFDVDVPGAEFRESDAVAPGEVLVTVDLQHLGEWTRPGAELGLSICYDIRFPELTRILALRGATITAVPAAFTATTGPPHWEILLRARAIENQIFVIAAGQCGATNDRLRWHGHSMIIDPWGTMIAVAPGDGASEAVIVADLDLDEQQRVRAVLPSLANRQPSAYRWPD
jgi:predicted amidohydrolase